MTELVATPEVVSYDGDWGVVGHSWALRYLKLSLRNGRLRHAYLITGSSGVGKSSLAMALTLAANCTSVIRPCGVCRACRLIKEGRHPDVTVVRAEDRTLKIDQIREMQHVLSLYPVEGRYRIVLLENFQEASPQAGDALLKTLEEPPPFVILILTAEYTDGLLPTIKSRCQPIALRPLPAALIRSELEARKLADPEQAALIAQLAGGRLGWALSAAADPAMLTARTSALDLLETAIGGSRIQRFQIAEKLTTDHKEHIVDILGIWQSFWRDVLILVSASPIDIVNRDRRHALDQVAAALHLGDAARALIAIRETTQLIDKNVNLRLALEVLMLDLPQCRLFAALKSTS